MASVRNMLAVVLLAFGMVSLPVLATSQSTDQSDLWWNPDESGWGIQFIHRGNVIFATMFVYDPDGKPTWYTATLSMVPADTLIWVGELYATNGPWFGTVPFNPALVQYRKVGTMNWTTQVIGAGVLRYSVDGVPVTKNVVRLFAGYDDFRGNFRGGVYQTTFGCSNAALNGATNRFATFGVAQTGTNITLSSAVQNGPSCSLVGSLSQLGQFGTIVGVYTCDSGEVGNFQLYEMNVGWFHISARFVANSTNNGCQSSGYLGGVRQQ